MKKMVKCRKEHECCFCNRKILKGEIANFWSIRGPKLDEHDRQIGIFYNRAYLCQKPDCEEVGNNSLNLVEERAMKKLTIAEKNYIDFISADYGISFVEWLGINVPTLEYSTTPGGSYLYRYCRDRYKRNEILGDWKQTKKSARESYKLALKNARLRVK